MDEVHGRLASSGAEQSDVFGNSNECAQCAESGKIVSAAGFCRTCTDYLCTACISQHKSFRGTRDHELQQIENKVEQKPVRSEVEKCAVHSDRPIEAYCADDDTFGCALCLLGGHKTCLNKALISDLSCDVESSREFLDTEKAAERFEVLEDHYKHAIQQCLSINDDCHTKTLEGFKKFRTEILNMVEKIGEKVHEEADSLKKENERQLKTLAEQVAKYSEIIKQHIVDIVGKKGRNEGEHIFIALKKNGKHVLESVQRLETIHQNIAIKAFNFHSDTHIKRNLSDTSKIIAETFPFPSVKSSKSVDNDSNICNQTPLSPATTCTSESQVNIKSHEDKYTCDITGMINLSESKLILADKNNHCLKLFDTTSNTITKRRVLTSAPWDITKVSDSHLAVSFPDTEQIQFFKADQTLDPCGSIKVLTACYGLRSTGDRLIVSYTNPAQVQILDMAGTVLQTLQDASENKLFWCPVYFSLSQDNKLIYVSDYNNNAVTCMSTTGTVQWVYQDQQLKEARGVATGDGGCLYISSRRNNTIHVVSSDGVRLAMIQLRHTEKIDAQSVCYIRQNRTLYVSRWSYQGYGNNNISRLSLQ